MLSERLHSWGNKNSLISKYQAAYKKCMGCEDHIYTLHAGITYNLGSGYQSVYALFVDLSQAFDTISHERLWKKLHIAGLSTKFVGIIKSI